jgi:hypothetical protein
MLRGPCGDVATWVTVLLVVIGIGLAVEAATSGRVGTVSGQVIQVGAVDSVGPDTAHVVQGVVTLTNVTSGTSYQVSSNQPGGYSIEFPVGTYDVSGISVDDYSDGSPMRAYGVSSVVVSSGRTVHVDLYVPIR